MEKKPKRRGPGRPRVPVRKSVYPIRLDPKDVTRLKELAAKIPGATPAGLARDLLRAAMRTFVPPRAPKLTRLGRDAGRRPSR